MRAIDLYSGVGGWSLGLALAGIEVVASFECSPQANETNFLNNGHTAHTVDIRRLSFDQLPDDIDVVVGSPPCTQFSYSNRGGGGDISDGLEDIKCFLRIVRHLQPRFWAMENVVRVAGILRRELVPGGRLEEFGDLPMQIEILSLEEFGVPQKRRRCIVGNFDFDLLHSYSRRLPRKTLGDVVSALVGPKIHDPNFSLVRPADKVFDHELEVPLNAEEVRLNKAAKCTHHIYNAMAFPDPLDRPSRTVTATCTRVCRESIIIPTTPESNGFRRLTIRERACLQGFPITFQFFGDSYTQKLRMVGNAVPPGFSYCIGKAMQGIVADKFQPLQSLVHQFNHDIPAPRATPSEQAGKHFPTRRKFRLALPGLHMKSGVRFELANDFVGDVAQWSICLFFGTPKAIQVNTLDPPLYSFARAHVPSDIGEEVQRVIGSLDWYLANADLARMQQVWSHKGPGGTRPFDLFDKLDEAGVALARLLQPFETMALLDTMAKIFSPAINDLQPNIIGVSKLRRNASLVHAGILVGTLANNYFRAFPQTLMALSSNRN